MPISKLAHYSIRAMDMEASRRFYVEVLGFKVGYRPPFKFPGIWLYLSDDKEEYGTVHIIGIDPDAPQGLVDYLGDRSADSLKGSGALDHIAFNATGLAEMHATLKARGIAYRERTVPDLRLHQVFIVDPSGIVIELNYPAAEAGSSAKA